MSNPPVTAVDQPPVNYAIILTASRTIRKTNNIYVIPVGTVIRFEMLSPNKITAQGRLKADETAVPAASWKLGDIVS